MMMLNNSTLFMRAQAHIPGGVNSPVRAFNSVGGTPRFFARGEGAFAWDIEGNRFVDYIGSWGPLILGHAQPEVVAAVCHAASLGMSFGAPTAGEVALAELVCELVPSIEQLRLVSSGSEATMSAIRLARGFTGRDVIVKFEGGYHGHADALLVKAGSGALTQGQPSSAGVPVSVSKDTWVLDYNDSAQVRQLFAEHGDKIAAIIVEPVAGNMNMVAPIAGFLETLREVCDASGAVLIFDEVMTGFRVALGGAQALYGVKPDLTTLGKILGGGLPLAGFGGRADIMACIAPLGAVYQAGTLSGNPLAVAAGLATLQHIRRAGFYEELSLKTQALVDGLVAAGRAAGVACSGLAIGGMFGLFFRETPPSSYAEVMTCDKAAFNRFFHVMLSEGIYLAPSAYEAGFVSIAHDDETLALTLTAAKKAFACAADKTQALG